jgi:putative endopeptidase
MLLLASALCASLAATPSLAAGKPQLGQWGVDLSSIDKSAVPGNDFFDYVNGEWLKTATIPPDRSSTGSFLDLAILSEQRTSDIIKELEAKPYDQLDPNEKKLRDLYDAFLDQKTIGAKGMAPAKADLDRIEHLKTRSQIAAIMGSVKLMTASPFNLGIGVDDKNPNAYSIDLGQGGLGMPNRDYYLKTDKPILDTQAAYKTYLVKMLTLAGVPNAQKRAAAVYALEAKIAAAQWPNEDRRDEDKIYNPMPVSALETLAPGFDWKAFFTEADVPLTSPNGERQVIVAEKSAFPKLAAIFAKTPVPVWRDYLVVHYMHTFAPYLPKAVDDANFDFYGKVIAGQSEQLPRATRAGHLLDNNLGEALGQIYVAKYFPPEAKAKALDLVHNLLKVYEADLQTLDWMTPETRQKALDKLHKFTPHIGYPDKWRDYSAYTVTRDDLIADVQNGAAFEWNRELKRIDQPVDKEEWDMTPQTVNAYYNPSFNEVVFPAAILQPPFFDPNADDAVNYGGIGAVIGHEISHGFDDQGSKYNGDGKLENWWTDEDRKNFEARTKALGAQYGSYEPLPGLHINGAFTMGENIADLAGLTIAYKAYHLSLNGKEAPVLDGFTGDQRFFLSFGQIWRTKQRDSALRAQVLSNEHSPAHYRVDGVTRNLDPWYTAFDVKPTEKFYLAPESRVHLW